MMTGTSCSCHSVMKAGVGHCVSDIWAMLWSKHVSLSKVRAVECASVSTLPSNEQERERAAMEIQCLTRASRPGKLSTFSMSADIVRRLCTGNQSRFTLPKPAPPPPQPTPTPTPLPAAACGSAATGWSSSAMLLSPMGASSLPTACSSSWTVRTAVPRRVMSRRLFRPPPRFTTPVRRHRSPSRRQRVHCSLGALRSHRTLEIRQAVQAQVARVWAAVGVADSSLIRHMRRTRRESRVPLA
mmetsp:Transcript_17607/g.53259  ORF Transcript_17607/g.53259 Transcript_17607/m.53259 type:complete len:242 (-) Transcript_17607:34-759(-)